MRVRGYKGERRVGVTPGHQQPWCLVMVRWEDTRLRRPRFKVNLGRPWAETWLGGAGGACLLLLLTLERGLLRKHLGWAAGWILGCTGLEGSASPGHHIGFIGPSRRAQKGRILEAHLGHRSLHCLYLDALFSVNLGATGFSFSLQKVAFPWSFFVTSSHSSTYGGDQIEWRVWTQLWEP